MMKKCKSLHLKILVKETTFFSVPNQSDFILTKIFSKMSYFYEIQGFVIAGMICFSVIFIKHINTIVSGEDQKLKHFDFCHQEGLT